MYMKNNSHLVKHTLRKLCNKYVNAADKTGGGSCCKFNSLFKEDI